MIWAVQDSMTWTALENNVKPLLAALQQLDRSVINVGYAADHPALNPGFITGLGGILDNINIFFYGSTKLAEMAAKKGYKPGSFYHDDWWNPDTWTKHRTDMLNQSVEIKTIGDLCRNWITEPTFIKPVGAKEFAGQVIEVEEKDDWINEYGLVLGDALQICCSSLQNIEREWRFFIIEGKVITGSIYKKYRCNITKEPISNEMWNRAQQFADVWLPNPTIVMDIAQLANGEFRVIEFNSVNSSGFYNSDIKKYIAAIEEHYDRKDKEFVKSVYADSYHVDLPTYYTPHSHAIIKDTTTIKKILMEANYNNASLFRVKSIGIGLNEDHAWQNARLHIEFKMLEKLKG